MQLKSSAVKLGFAVLSSSSLAAVILAVGGTTASAQFTIQSTGTLSGTIQLPRNNPNFNRNTTRVDTNSSGTYSRSNGVPVYQSNYVQVRTLSNGSLSYFVDFKGIPVVSFNGILNSPVLSGGELTPYTYQGQLPGTKFQGVVQDEFGLTKGFYTGVVTDPSTGQQYQGTFEVSGQGPRYSDRNGSATPTVFDFKSDLPGRPTVTSLQMNNSPLVRLTIKVPANATPVTPTTPTPVTPTTPTPVTPTTSTLVTPTTPTPVTPTTPTPVTPTTPTPVTPTTPTPVTPTTSTLVTPTTSTLVTPTTSTLVTPTTPTPVTPITSTFTHSVLTNASPKPSAVTNSEFSSGNSFVANTSALESSSVSSASCSMESVSCPTKLPKSKPVIGPRSRVLVR